MKLSIMVQFHNELNYMPYWFSNILDLADEVIVGVDTSGDGCKEWLDLLYLGVPLHIVTVANDIIYREGFAALRNQLVKYATGDWILWLDADEILEASRHDIEAAISGAETAVSFRRLTMVTAAKPHWTLDNLLQIKQESEFVADPQIRLFKNNIGIHWKGLLHEELFLPSGQNLSTVANKSALEIYHYSNLALPGRNHRKAMQASELLLRLVEHPELREGINPYWYTEFYEANKRSLEEYREGFRKLL